MEHRLLTLLSSLVLVVRLINCPPGHSDFRCVSPRERHVTICEHHSRISLQLGGHGHMMARPSSCFSFSELMATGVHMTHRSSHTGIYFQLALHAAC
mmetsp:Transcript_23228/g.71177  ORF Transcript_23228/g.71177 Transcript_23228/m.71177 type:complete len:97 (-) Transcript_23228:514-804(-)